jgi:hypothetical protein
MKIILNKKNFFIFALITLFIGIVFLLFHYFVEFPSIYKTYSSYGNVIETEESRELTIKAFLESVEESKKKDCYNFVEMSESLEEFKICIDKKKVNWENPYEDYSILIPVEAVFSYDKVMFNIFSLHEVNISLLEDDEVLDFLYELPDKVAGNLPVRIKSNEEITAKGYYYQDIEGEDFIAVTILDSFIDEIKFNNDQIEVYFTSLIHGKEVLVKATVQELGLTTFGNQQEEVTKFINENNVNLIKFGSNCLITFKLENSVDLEKFMEENFSNQEEYSELNLEVIAVSQEVANED